MEEVRGKGEGRGEGSEGKEGGRGEGRGGRKDVGPGTWGTAAGD